MPFTKDPQPSRRTTDMLAAAALPSVPGLQMTPGSSVMGNDDHTMLVEKRLRASSRRMTSCSAFCSASCRVRSCSACSGSMAGLTSATAAALLGFGRACSALAPLNTPEMVYDGQGASYRSLGPSMYVYHHQAAPAPAVVGVQGSVPPKCAPSMAKWLFAVRTTAILQDPAALCAAL